MKKVYIKPELEIFEVEPAGVMLMGSSLDMDGPANGDFEELSNKREPEAPWSKSPWE